MTRYTKLEGRRSLAKKTYDDSDDEPSSSVTSKTTPGSKSQDVPTPSSSEPEQDRETTSASVDAEAEAEAGPSTAPSTEKNKKEEDQGPPTVEKLLKRAKLLKLKAKKAKNEESRKRFQKMTREVERQVETMFGAFEYGPKGKPVWKDGRDQQPQHSSAAQSRSQSQSGYNHYQSQGSQGGAGFVRRPNPFSTGANRDSSGGDQGWGNRSGAAGSYSNSNSNGFVDGYNNNINNDYNQGYDQNQEQWKMDRRDARREERAVERQKKLKCFACRGFGHSAKECPNVLDAQSIVLKPDASSGGDGGATSTVTMIGRDAVGICFRCGSSEHTLARCPKKGKDKDDLPYATCFICGQKGHLSSKCPNNKERGVYPEGGCCKLCGKVDHLAKDCPLSLRREGTQGGATNGTAMNVVGSTKDTSVGVSGGGDEDEFHNFARKRAQVEEESRQAKKSKKDSTAKSEDGGKKTKVISF